MYFQIRGGVREKHLASVAEIVTLQRDSFDSTTISEWAGSLGMLDKWLQVARPLAKQTRVETAPPHFILYLRCDQRRGYRKIGWRQGILKLRLWAFPVFLSNGFRTRA